jgi:mono/diheme cytochrome c family protein
MKNQLFKYLLFTLVPFHLWAQANWEKGFEVHSPRENVYQLSPQEFNRVVMQGRKKALFYPVTVSDLMIPHAPLKTFFETRPNDPVRKLLFELAKVVSPFQSMPEIYTWLGLHDFPSDHQKETPNPLPVLTVREKALPMGATLIQTKDGEALTFGCAACHSADLFGVKVLGLTNRFPRANDFFRQGAEIAPYVNSFVFKQVLQTTEGERLMVIRAKHALKFVGIKKPVTLGLDTSLAQVALSLSKRGLDPYAERLKETHKNPRPNKLNKLVADSKPAVWWNVKHKNRWLSDGSIVSGNPVHTNFLWNEIGRGTDLKLLEEWMIESKKDIEALTAAVFATKSPRYENFFGVEAINIQKAKRGQSHYVQSCQKCHGIYEKAWDLPEAGSFSDLELIQTTKVTYHKDTPVKNVGTDPGRYLGMKEFAADLNRLQISKTLQAVVEPQKGYVPPPLDGIWSRWPYFHNNSIPNLCALLTKSSDRPKTYWAGPAKDKKKDFDEECVGYPLGSQTPAEWKKDPEYLYDTNKEGLSNSGHDDKIFLKEGREIYTRAEKLELIEFLKTL